MSKWVSISFIGIWLKKAKQNTLDKITETIYNGICKVKKLKKKGSYKMKVLKKQLKKHQATIAAVNDFSYRLFTIYVLGILFASAGLVKAYVKAPELIVNFVAVSLFTFGLAYLVTHLRKPQ